MMIIGRGRSYNSWGTIDMVYSHIKLYIRQSALSIVSVKVLTIIVIVYDVLCDNINLL